MLQSILTLIVVFLASSITLFAQSNNKTAKSDAILGQWINADKNAKFEIYKDGKQYFGKIIWGTGGDTKDVKNPNPKLRNRNLVGLTILENFVFEGKNTWSGGSIYDPKDGKTYCCKITLISNQKLEVRGFLGISLFGRTEVWKKIIN
ncbi:MAG: DUF2147 domain-containing protein [Bernardetiaceae bacterium]|nr:DUF2147 domain-containing protein [Bernardetiaceae bacterium]